ncbi:iron complex transport system ATP-binding protein [Evansella vedderi]|uniref:Iron complex transport system ATP-binding protein n=1 Tax=Evansella vedderi TaxID=38282 RepID=A0ABT9ZYN2_9BACI|nr:adenosylcobinamide amidohydrolase [Evansella vedderi]MDQ0256352.1 iron complex transport system ATP-binding protein [Evansella vedderi]
MLSLKNVVGGYSNTPIIKGIDLAIEKGEFFALLGPNGSGKTTLFKLITGQLPLQKGEVSLSGQSLPSFTKLEKAKKIAVLSQEAHVSFDYTVEEIISLGRYPHQKGFLKKLSKEDWNVIENVMEITKTKQFQKTQFRMISGGEKQRVLLAKALAQEPEMLLLDEPTNHLDIKHTFQMIDLLKKWQQTKGLTIFAILHDLNVASLYADRVGLLHHGKFLEVGDINTLRKEDQLEKVYEVQVKTQSHPTIPKPQLLMTPNYVQTNEWRNFSESFSIEQNEKYIHLQFNQPLRTISNGVIGEGIQWIQHFCNFHVEKHYHCSEPDKDIRNWMEEYNIPHHQAVGMMTAVKLEDMVVCTKRMEDISIMAVVTAGIGNAVDISSKEEARQDVKIGTINTMVFIDAHFSDGALVNGIMSATEGKVKALQDLQIKDPLSNTLASGTSTDSLLLAVTQQGESTPYAGSGTLVGKGIGEVVYEATAKAVKKYWKRVKVNDIS